MQPISSTALFIAALLTSFSTSFNSFAASSVTANLLNGKKEKIGTAVFTENLRGVKIEITAEKLPPGKHAVHIHENGSCEAPSFKSAGNHYNPNGQAHGFNHEGGPHIGDLPNLFVDSDGKVHTEIFDQNVTLNSGSNALLKKGGTALVIHAKEDDNTSQPAGNSGDRIACAEIKGESK